MYSSAMALVWKLFVLYATNYAFTCVNASIVKPSLTPYRNNDRYCREYLLVNEERMTELEAMMSRHEALWSKAAQRISQLERSVSEHDVVLSERDQRIEELQKKVTEQEESLVTSTQRITQLTLAIIDHRNAQTKRSTQGVFTTDLEHDETLADADPHIHVPMLDDSTVDLTLKREEGTPNFNGTNDRKHSAVDSDDDTQQDIGELVDQFRSRNGSLDGMIKETTVVHKGAVRVSPAVPSGVAFSASMSAITTHLHVNEAIVFDSVMANVGGGYNPHDGIFIVPESGVYVFTWTTVAIGHSNIRTEIHINGVAESTLGSYGSNLSNNQSATGVIVKSVTVGDRVYIKNKLDGTIASDINAKSTFSGWRLFQ